jgi:hypothetical protein
VTPCPLSNSTKQNLSLKLSPFSRVSSEFPFSGVLNKIQRVLFQVPTPVQDAPATFETIKEFWSCLFVSLFSVLKTNTLTIKLKIQNTTLNTKNSFLLSVTTKHFLKPKTPFKTHLQTYH